MSRARPPFAVAGLPVFPVATVAHPATLPPAAPLVAANDEPAIDALSADLALFRALARTWPWSIALLLWGAGCFSCVQLGALWLALGVFMLGAVGLVGIQFVAMAIDTLQPEPGTGRHFE